jgi:hypothetical protein
MKNILLLLILVSVSACSSPTARDSVQGKWQVMTTNTKKEKMLCYAGTGPISSEGTFKDREQAYLTVTRRTSGKLEISTSSGYEYKKSSKVELVAGKKTYRLFFKGDTAWARSDADDKAIIAAIKTGEKIGVRGLSKKNLTSIDTYSAEGFNAALKRVRDLCP